MSDPSECQLSKFVIGLIGLTIIVSCVSFFMESHPAFHVYPGKCSVCRPLSSSEVLDPDLVAQRASYEDICADCQPITPEGFAYLEIACVTIFTIEYAIRFFLWPFIPSAQDVPSDFKPVRTLKRIRRFITAAPNIIDILSVLPFYIGLILASDNVNLTIVRVLRLLRLLRFIRFGVFSEGLLLFIQVLRKSLGGFSILLTFTFLAMVVFGSLIFIVEHGEWNPASGVFERNALIYLKPKEYSPFTSIPNSFWWVLVTMATVGYGDMSPTSDWGMVIGIFTMYTGIIFLAMPITIFGASFAAMYNSMMERRMERIIYIDSVVSRVFLRVIYARCSPVKRAFLLWRYQAASVDEAAVDEEEDQPVSDMYGGSIQITEPKLRTIIGEVFQKEMQELLKDFRRDLLESIATQHRAVVPGGPILSTTRDPSSPLSMDQPIS